MPYSLFNRVFPRQHSQTLLDQNVFLHLIRVLASIHERLLHDGLHGRRALAMHRDGRVIAVGPCHSQHENLLLQNRSRRDIGSLKIDKNIFFLNS